MFYSKLKDSFWDYHWLIGEEIMLKDRFLMSLKKRREFSIPTPMLKRLTNKLKHRLYPHGLYDVL